jgi:hypothetical protein
LYAEYTFDTINEDTRYEVEQQYADMIRRKLNPDVESICNPVQDGLRVDPENGGLDDSPNISDNQQIYSRDFGTEPEFCREITLWVNIYLQSQAEENFQPYKIMKVFILQHALSLGLRGREPRNEWREAAATSMTELILDRFYVCEAIIFSLFLRRQYAILDVDSARARNTLHFLPPEIWGVANPEIREYLTDIHVFRWLVFSKVVIQSNSAGRRRSDLSLYKNVEVLVRRNLILVSRQNSVCEVACFISSN